MTTIADWAERPNPIDAGANIATARERFLDEPGVSALAVVEAGRAIGVVSRTMILAVDEGRASGDESIRRLTAAPRTLAADTPAADALAALLADGGCSDGVVVMQEDRYVGLLTQSSLLRSLNDGARGPAQTADRRRFVEMLGREVRTPMTGILAVAELLQRQPLTADAKAYVQTIVDSSDRLVRLLDDAISLALGETGRLETQAGPVRLRELMDGIQSDWQERRAQNVAVLVSYDGEPDLGVLADSGRLRQVFGHLIAAAVKATGQGAVEASLKARVTAEGVRLEGRVRDAGPGLPPEKLARIFEPTAQAEESGRAGWTGIGPALCRHIVEAMHGAIGAESNVGEGVTVTFTMMAARLDAESGEDAPGQIAGKGGLHVLVVDDNATNRMVAEGLCEMFDCTSESAVDGVEAVEAAKTGRFDLILMDIKMPRMDGMEATRIIRGLPGAAGKTPIIALTANADPEDAKAYVACGMCSVVEKPIKPERLLLAMNAALDRLPDSARAA